MFEFRDNNVVDFSPGAIVPMTYRIEGDELILPSATNGGPEQKMKIAWRGADHLSLIFQTPEDLAGEPRRIDFARTGKSSDPRNPIVGEWVGTAEIGDGKHEFRYLFYPAGKVLLLIPFRTQRGSFTVKDGTIRLVLPGTDAVEGKFKIEGDVLTIPGPAGSGESTFARY